MPNQPRPDNPARQVRVEDDLWHASKVAASKEGTTVSEVVRDALRDLVAKAADDDESTQPEVADRVFHPEA